MVWVFQLVFILDGLSYLIIKSQIKAYAWLPFGILIHVHAGSLAMLLLN